MIHRLARIGGRYSPSRYCNKKTLGILQVPACDTEHSSKNEHSNILLEFNVQ